MENLFSIHQFNLSAYKNIISCFIFLLLIFVVTLEK